MPPPAATTILVHESSMNATDHAQTLADNAQIAIVTEQMRAFTQSLSSHHFHMN
jgi:hypothetical protein